MQYALAQASDGRHFTATTDSNIPCSSSTAINNSTPAATTICSSDCDNSSPISPESCGEDDDLGDERDESEHDYCIRRPRDEDSQTEPVRSVEGRQAQDPNEQLHSTPPQAQINQEPHPFDELGEYGRAPLPELPIALGLSPRDVLCSPLSPLEKQHSLVLDDVIMSPTESSAYTIASDSQRRQLVLEASAAAARLSADAPANASCADMQVSL